MRLVQIFHYHLVIIPTKKSAASQHDITLVKLWHHRTGPRGERNCKKYFFVRSWNSIPWWAEVPGILDMHKGLRELEDVFYLFLCGFWFLAPCLGVNGSLLQLPSFMALLLVTGPTLWPQGCDYEPSQSNIFLDRIVSTRICYQSKPNWGMF